jgi:hypothetical protein
MLTRVRYNHWLRGILEETLPLRLQKYHDLSFLINYFQQRLHQAGSKTVERRNIQ